MKININGNNVSVTASSKRNANTASQEKLTLVPSHRDYLFQPKQPTNNVFFFADKTPSALNKLFYAIFFDLLKEKKVRVENGKLISVCGINLGRLFEDKIDWDRLNGFYDLSNFIKTTNITAEVGEAEIEAWFQQVKIGRENTFDRDTVQAVNDVNSLDAAEQFLNNDISTFHDANAESSNTDLIRSNPNSSNDLQTLSDGDPYYSPEFKSKAAVTLSLNPEGKWSAAQWTGCLLMVVGVLIGMGALLGVAFTGGTTLIGLELAEKSITTGYTLLCLTPTSVGALLFFGSNPIEKNNDFAETSSVFKTDYSEYESPVMSKAQLYAKNKTN